MKDVVPEFNPEAQRTNEWIQKVDDLAADYGWPVTTITHFATLRFAGIAKIWYDSLPTLKKTWLEWKILLTSTFKDRENAHESLHDVLYMQKRENQSYYNYVFEKLSALLRTRVNWTLEQQLDLLIGGLPSDVRISARARKVADPAELANFLCEYDVRSPAQEPRLPEEGDNTEPCSFCGRKGHASPDPTQREILKWQLQPAPASSTKPRKRKNQTTGNCLEGFLFVRGSR